MENTSCPCRSGNAYANCCEPFHQGQEPKTALQLMRSRYSAYAFNIPTYIIRTTHPASPHFCCDADQWSQNISQLYQGTEFKDLEIFDFQEEGSFASVTFFACLMQDGKNVSFTERSYFEKIQGKWLYRNGQLSEGYVPKFLHTSVVRFLPFAYYGHPILRKVADPVLHITHEICQLVEKMIETMDAYQGIGLAAPQVHHSLQLFVIRKPVELHGKRIASDEVKIFINPELSMPSSDMWRASEGCLSIPSIYADIERPKEMTVEYSDLKGNKIKERVSGWEARVIMHENDHLNGILFIDHLTEKERESLESPLAFLYARIHQRTEP